MADKFCVKRLQKEYRALCKEPVQHVAARPSPNDILEWHYVLEGSEGTPFAGGFFYGKIKFPPDYPFKPPGISMTTPNGRFMTQRKLCLSMSDFHPETWNPMWSISTILTGLLSFMMDTDSLTSGSISTTVAEKQHLARTSLDFNCKNVTFRKMFPDYVEMYELRKKKRAEERSEGGRDGCEEVESMNGGRNNTQKQSVPVWMVFLLFSVLGAVMALPFLQF